MPTESQKYFQVPATNSPGRLFEHLRKNYDTRQVQEVISRLYPKGVRLIDGELIIPHEYIIVGEVYTDYSFLTVGKEFTLRQPVSGFEVRVNVLKNRRCGRTARPIILLGAVDTDSLVDLADIPEVLQVAFGENIVGEIHSGKSNGSGSSEGYPNAYGTSRPVLPDYLLPLFAAFSPDTSTCSGPVPLPHIIIRTTNYRHNPVKVAILDTGLTHLLSQAPAPAGTCDTVHTGWNFVADTANIGDDHPCRHGTRIAAIIQQQAPSAVCLPVKTAHASGTCELYDVLCGLEYARVNGASVLNASFSFPSDNPPDQAIPLLHALISVLENENIWIVSAAGNAIQYGHTPASLGVSGPYLYPACYSRNDNYDRVLTVTTVSTRHPLATPGSVTSFSLDECYSPAYVDIGVIANGQPPAAVYPVDKRFRAPGFTDPEPGTSYATAYMSGLVAKAIATEYIDGKTQLITVAMPQTIPGLAFGIRTQRGITV